MSARVASPYTVPFVQTRDLFARPDAKETVDRLIWAVSPDAPRPELTVVLTAVAVLRARDAAERLEAGA